MIEAGGGGNADMDAGEYVIGTLDPAEREAFAARMQDDAVLRRAMAEWERRFAGLALRVDPVDPSPLVWAGIQQALRVQTSRPLPFRVIQGGNRPAHEGLALLDYRRSRNRWRVSALTGFAAAAAFLGVLVDRELSAPPVGQPRGTFVAAVNRGGDKPALIIRVDLKSRRVEVRPVAVETPPGHSLELWFLSGTSAPRSMGLVKATPATLAIPQDAKPDADMTFAVSVEPPGGSKTGGPTGPVVYSGQLVDLK